MFNFWAIRISIPWVKWVGSMKTWGWQGRDLKGEGLGKGRGLKGMGRGLEGMVIWLKTGSWLIKFWWIHCCIWLATSGCWLLGAVALSLAICNSCFLDFPALSCMKHINSLVGLWSTMVFSSATASPTWSVTDLFLVFNGTNSFFWVGESGCSSTPINNYKITFTKE